jgi:hypothetical protein
MRLRLEQHEMLEKRLQGMLTAPRPEFLATPEERVLLGRVEQLEQRHGESGGAMDTELGQRLDRLRGRLTWTIETEYHERLTQLDRSLQELHSAVGVLNEQYQQFVRVRQAASHSYEGFDRPINRLRTRVRQALSTVERLMARQGRAIEIVAIDELQARRTRLQDYRNKARYALADSYDRATQIQARRTEPE